jgi:hypothetical protein
MENAVTAAFLLVIVAGSLATHGMQQSLEATMREKRTDGALNGRRINKGYPVL